jgi:hypothetical protein
MTQLLSKVNPPVELENDGIVLNSGLDLTSSSLQVEKGALRDCLNIEVVDRLGYQVIGGFDRYDGSLGPDQVEFWAFPISGLGSPSPGEVIADTGVSPQTKFGVCVEVRDVAGTDWVIYARFDADAVVQSGTSLVPVVDGLTLPFSSTATAVRYTESAALPSGDDAQDIFEDYQTWNAVLRSRVSTLPSQPIGLHWYRDRLYAVVDELQLGFNSGGTTEITPNSIIANQAGTFYAKVLKVNLVSGTWAGGDAAGTMLVEPVEFFNGIQNIFTITPPTSGDFDLVDAVRTISVTPNVLQSNAFTARALTATDPAPEYAGLWRTSPEPDPGWEYIESGWKVNYEDGIDQFGELTRITRSVDNNFQYQSDDSDTTGLNGQAVSFFNGFSFPGEISSVRPTEIRARPGWRDTNDLTTFATTDEALETVDSRFLQADLSWGIFGRQPTNTANPGSVPTFVLGSLVAGYEDPAFDGASGISWGANTGPEVFPNAGNSDAMSFLTFVNLGEILGNLPNKINVTGIEIEINCDILHQYQQQRPNAEDVDFVANAVADKFSFQAALGKINTETGNFERIGSKEITTVSLPTTQAGYTEVDTYSPGTNLTQGQAYYEDTNVDISVGGPSATYGNNTIKLEDLSSGLFGIAVWAGAVDAVALAGNAASWAEVSGDVPNAGGWIRFKINRLRIKLHYTQPAARYYITDDFTAGTPSVCSADLVAYSVLTGQLENENATGVMQFVNIQPVSGAFKSCILQGDTIHQLDISTGTLSAANQVAVVSGSTAGAVGMELNGFPSLEQIVEEGSRYQFITANFFAREDWDGFYGVSGAGKAFSFAAFDADDDGDEEQYIQFITTNTVVPDEDEPRHVAFHQYHLALGYRDGTVRFSVPGEPENFDGLLGAAEVGVGDRVTGLLGMRGKALGVFCDGSIYTILGDNADTFNVEVLSPYSGAIEYTVVDNGGQPLYCDNRGISTLEQSQRYGNFVGFRISQKVTPWLLPRMTRNDDLFALDSGAGVVCAVPVRSKNQYRIFFRDGFFLTYTAMPDGSGAFTYGLYYLDETKAKYFVPFAHSSQVDTDGRERIHMAHYSPRSTISTADSRYVYEFENGLGFDGDWFDWSYTTAFAYKDPFRDNTIRKVNVDGLTKGASWATITVAKDYDEDSYSTTLVPLNLPRNPSAVPSVNFKPSSVMANVAKEGRSLSFRVQRSSAIKTLTPPIVHQALLVQYQSGGKRDS